MDFKYMGIFGGKHFRLNYSIEDNLIEELCDDRDIDYELITDEDINSLGLEILMGNPGYNLSNRTDILIRTSDRLLVELEEFRMESERLTLYEKLLDILTATKPGTEMWDLLENIYTVNSIEEVVEIIKMYQEVSRSG